MPDDEKLTPADPKDIADSIAFALRFSGRKRVHHADAFYGLDCRAACRPTFGALRVRLDEAASYRRFGAIARSRRLATYEAVGGRDSDRSQRIDDASMAAPLA